jgi:hypothetical protein
LAAAHTPTARGRSWGLNSTVSTDSDNGITAAAPSPSSTRAPMNAPADGAKATASEPSPNSASAPSRIFLRP